MAEGRVESRVEIEIGRVETREKDVLKMVSELLLLSSEDGQFFEKKDVADYPPEYLYKTNSEINLIEIIKA